MNYENLAGFIESSDAQNPAPSRRPRNAELYTTHNGPRYQNAAQVRAGHGLANTAFGSAANHMGAAQTAPRFTQNLRQDRSNLSSTLYDFIRENDGDPDLAQHGGQHPGGDGLHSLINFEDGLAHGNRGGRNNQLDQTGLEINTDIDFLDTQQLEYI